GGISTNGVIGSDGRSKVSDTEVEPYSAICYVESTWSDGSVSCGTAFIIYSDVALTAAHMVYDADLGEWAEEVKLWPGKDGYGFWNNPYGTTTASNMVVSKSWTSSEADDYDWAILDLEDSIGDETGWFGISTSVSSGTSVTISGYPYDYRYYQYKMSGTLSSVETRKLYYSIDTSEGQSGSPIYRATTSGYTAYGIHTTVELENGEVVENSGARITSQLYEYCVEHMG
ncbi:MAG: trypsin-like serine protease, partial [Firmicutes bacterium]|nr:trypsin-like serine protease [Bacillota bacterium]